MTDHLSDRDYDTYLDGKPRYEGIKAFLSARDILLADGDQGDAPGHATIAALGNRKNELFHAIIRDEGVEIYEEAVDRLRHWRSQGYRTAIVSSSKNCRRIIEQAGIDDLFDVRIDGEVAEERGLKGKPHPDIFLEAARDLSARPTHCIVFEDAISGVEAGQRAFFGLVVGVARFGNRSELLEHGADICIGDFSGFDLSGAQALDFFRFTRPMVFSRESDLFQRLDGKEPAFFLDYDGTLTPIVKRPEDARLSDGMRQSLAELASRYTVAVVTGRDKEEVQRFIGLDQLIYSGSHGYITSGPDGLHMEHEDAERIIEQLDQVEKDLHELLEGHTEGVQIDRKRFAIALHYRNARKEDVPRVYDAVEKMLERHDGLKSGEGKKVVEIKPGNDWHKGKAVLWIMEALGLDKRADVIPLFIGDDVTDEDAFEILKGRGIGILVENRGQDTAAEYSLKNVFQVRAFFQRMVRRSQ